MKRLLLGIGLCLGIGFSGSVHAETTELIFRVVEPREELDDDHLPGGIKRIEQPLVLVPGHDPHEGSRRGGRDHQRSNEPRQERE